MIKLNFSKTFLIAIVGFIVTIVAFTVLANKMVSSKTEKLVSDNVNELPRTKVGLLLGTSRLLSNGSKNAYFFNRINAAVELYQSNKIKVIIVSGDNSNKNYDEPSDMKMELMARGIPESAIYLDYAGLRTLDSVVRAKEIFGQDSLIVISQKFHNERAVYIASRNGIAAFGYNAKEVKAFKGLKTKVREYFARDKVFIDLKLGVKPKFLGEKVVIE